jgi:hypothetical protein
MQVDIAKAYLEIQRLRKAVQEAEFAVRIACARGHRRRHSGRVHARGLQSAQPQMPLAKRGRS